MKNINLNIKHAILLVLYVFLIVRTNAQNKVEIVECGLGYSISNVLVIDTNGLVLAESNSLGEIELDQFNYNQKLTLYKLGYKPFKCGSIKVGSRICLSIDGYQIKEVIVSDSDFNYIETLKSFIERSQASMIDESREVYYSFNYTVTQRENQFEFKARGVIKIDLLPYTDKYSALGKKITFCSLNVIADSAIWFEEKLKEINIVIPLLKVWDDPMRKGGYLNSLKESEVFVRVKNGNNQYFYILDSLKSRASIYFNRDSTINLFYQYKVNNNINIEEDSIFYNEFKYLSYRVYKSSKTTSIRNIDYKVKIKSIRNISKYINRKCNLPYAIIFTPTKLSEIDNVDIEVK